MKIRTSLLAGKECDRYIELLLSGKYQEEFTPQEQLRMDIGKLIHEYIEKKEKEKHKKNILCEYHFETKYITGTADLILIDKENKKIKIIDIKTTSLYNIGKVKPAMIKQVCLYKYMTMLKYPDYAVSGYIRFVDRDNFKEVEVPINENPFEIWKEQEARAKKIIKNVKSGKLSKINPVYCQGCKAKKICQKNGKSLKEVVL